MGGTQANAAVADQILRPWEGIVSATTGHITAHEAGAVEACGRKTLPLPHVDGKLVAADVRALCEAYWGDENREHIVAPGAVYISHPTEYGTVYSLAELEALAQVCRDFDMRLFMDGARLGYGLAAVGADVTLADIARLCDAFYIGGTKVGAFCGEAVVFTKPGLDDHFFTLMKKRGALLAKGRFLGLQFDVLFGQEDGELRYQRIGRHAVELAQRIAEGFRAKDYELAIDSPTNQQFVILDDETKERLAEHASFGFWERTPDGRTVVRFATSWATRPESVNELLALLNPYKSPGSLYSEPGLRCVLSTSARATAAARAAGTGAASGFPCAGSAAPRRACRPGSTPRRFAPTCTYTYRRHPNP